MCQFFSGIQTKSGILFDMEQDSHEHLIKKYKLDDKTREPDFVRLELVPKKEPWNKDIANWDLTVDQDTLPKWFDEKFAKEDMWNALQLLWKEMLVENVELDEIVDRKIRWMVNSKINSLKGTSLVGAMWGSSKVGEMWGSSKVGVMRESSSVGEMRESSNVGEMRESSKVGAMWESSKVGAMWESSNVGEMWGSSFTVDYKEGYQRITCADPTSKIILFKKAKVSK